MHDPTDPNDPPPDLARLGLIILIGVAAAMTLTVILILAAR